MLALTLSVTLLACPLHPVSLDLELGKRALPGLPPDLARQLTKHPQAYRRGAEAAFAYPQAIHVMGPGNSLEEAVLAQCERLVAAIRGQASFEAVTAGFGALAHLVWDINFPVEASTEAEARAFVAFLQSRAPRIPVVFYSGYESLPFSSRETLWGFILAEASRVSPLRQALSEDFRRVGGPGFWNLLDDRSTAFGVASVSLNRAISQYVALSSWVWHHAGGLVVPFPGDGNRILVWKGELKPREAPLPRLGIR
ncbi:hypothetical protein EG19_06950 [Thermoanaerobaculum aquaticum]|uniref:Phospholipase C/D domain-containing protein n=1 Tax=Thermoanaerobaculum aquaticum TaxID=1312852 RepID=A0A062XQX3_9BACT|nr:hypothetical protein [Thermoanaerobaculum aquaticum]KDA53218.1 hypothetical protein EG19_06950 [Thermoanaerobaculum aquaticum]